jgi:molybdate transport repressor ModE-like protein
VRRGAVDRWVTPLDRRLLATLAADPNVVRSARRLRIGRDRAVYRLARLSRLFGGPVAEGRRGGTAPGGTTLTALGRRLIEAGRPARSPGNRWTGTYTARPTPAVRLGGGGRLEVSFRAREGATVTVELEPEAFVVARRPAMLSARNALRTTVVAVHPRPDGTAELIARWVGRPVRVALTAGSIGRLGLAPGARAVLYAKAVAVRRITRGSLRA